MSDQEIADLCRRLANVLTDESGRGMTSWVMVRNSLGAQLHAELSKVVGPADDELADEYQRGYSDGYESGSADASGEQL